MSSAFDTLATHGSVKERDFPYRCGGGNSEDHFDGHSSRSCRSAPWGAECPVVSGRNPYRWGNVHVGAAYRLPLMNVENMKNELVSKGAFTVTFNVYTDFFSFNFRNGNIYEEIASDIKRGAHAVALVGFGVKNGTPFWKLQNSWGSNWGDDGYFHMKSGINLCEIENYRIAAADVLVSVSKATTSLPSTAQPTTTTAQSSTTSTTTQPTTTTASSSTTTTMNPSTSMEISSPLQV